MWSPEHIADLAAGALEAQDRLFSEEQAVYGLDAMEELALHAVLARGFAAENLGVLREQPYPSQWRRKLKESKDLAFPLPRDRERCDLVLTARPGLTLADSLTTEKQIDAARREVAGTLFEPVADGEQAQAIAPQHVAPDEAYWLEVKSVGQFTLSSGVLGPNGTYASELVRGPLSDISKLAKDRDILHAGMLMILFTADGSTAEHDLVALLHRCLDRKLAISEPITRAIPINDRMGNACCTVALIPLRP